MANPPEADSENGIIIQDNAYKDQVDKDAQELVISSLRSQIQDLISQVSQLNNKLVTSYDRVSDLEDDLHVTHANLRSSSLKVSSLELERTQHLAALNTGLLVEKSHVTTELNRLMEKATEEAAQRGQAESARIAIEKEIDDLSASLFNQANSMVAEARYDKHLSERKVEEAQSALKTAEEALQLMQSQMQALQAEKEDSETKMQEMQVLMGKGKWLDKPHLHQTTPTMRLLTVHAPYQDYLAFLAHLRVLHTSAAQPPAMSTLLPLPFLARLLTEDSEPTVRLDLAPSLNWLSRRSVLVAIHSGQLTIEPISALSIFSESGSSTTVAGLNSTNDNVSCALCGALVFPSTSNPHTTTTFGSGLGSPHPNHGGGTRPSLSWSGSFFKKTSSNLSSGDSVPPSPTRTPTTQHHPSSHNMPTQIFIFRLASQASSGMGMGLSSLPIPSLSKTNSQSHAYSPSLSHSPSPSPAPFNSHAHSPSLSVNTNTTTANTGSTTIYPLCTSGWCLARLRNTCTLWAFVRSGVIEKVWEEELVNSTSIIPHSGSSAPNSQSVNSNSNSGAGAGLNSKYPAPPQHPTLHLDTNGKPPPVPPRKRSLWNIASAIGIGSGTTPLPPPPAKESTEPPTAPPPVPERPQRRVPPPPASAPSVEDVKEVEEEEKEKDKPDVVAPPLPKRSEVRSRMPESQVPSPTSSPAPATGEGVDADIDSASKTAEPQSTVEGSSEAEEQKTPTTTTATSDLPSEANANTASLSSTTTNILPTHHRHTSLTKAVDIPLPDSRPGTPGRTASPGGVPPPLPRRAAARAVRSVPPPPSTTTLPPPVLASAEMAKVEEEEGKEEVKKDEEDKGPKEEEDKPAEEAQGSKNTNLNVFPDRSTQASPASDMFVDALTPGEPLSEGEAGLGGVNVDKEEEKSTTTPVIDQETVKDVIDDTPKSDIKTEESLIVVEEDEKEKGKRLQEQEEDEEELAKEKEREEKERKEREEKERKGREGLVGDATWEERAWKEIVRLREEMFWARIGALRD